MLAAVAEPRLCLLVGATRFKTPQKDCITPPPNYAPTSSHAFVIYWWKACVDSCVLKYSDFLFYLRMVAVAASDPSAFARVRVSVADPYAHVFGPLECSARLCWNTDRPHKDPSGVGPWSCLTACLCLVSVSQALWDTEFCSIKAFSEPPGIFVMLSHSLDADSWLDVEIFLFFSYSYPPFTPTPWFARDLRVRLHLAHYTWKLLWRYFICTYFESFIWISFKSSVL